MKNVLETYKYLIEQTAKQNKLTIDQAAEKVRSVLSEGKDFEDAQRIADAVNMVKDSMEGA